MHESQTPRLKHQIDQQVFSRLLELALEVEWLQSRSNELVELWNLCETDKEIEMLEDMLKRFEYVDAKYLTHLTNLVTEQIVNVWGLSPDETLIVATSDDRFADGSQMFLYYLKGLLAKHDGWNETNLINRIVDSLSKVKGNYSVILIDDFIGTGNTIAKRVNWYRQRLKNNNIDNVSIYVVCIAAMEFSKSQLDSLDIIYFSPLWLKKALTEYYENEDLQEAIQAMERIETLLEPKVRKKRLPEFGYERSETLFAIDNANVPNNVFPIFWWPELKPKKKRSTLLNRML